MNRTAPNVPVPPTDSSNNHGTAVASGATSLATTFPFIRLHNPDKRKRIGWAWIKTENRPRHVAIVSVRSGGKIAYVLEIERTNQKHAVLVLARQDLQEIGTGEFREFLLKCAIRRGWVPESQMPGYQRRTTTYRELVDASVLESRIWRKIEKVFKIAEDKEVPY